MHCSSMSAPLMLTQPVASLSASRALMQHRTHVDAFHRNMIWTAGIHVVDEMGTRWVPPLLRLGHMASVISQVAMALTGRAFLSAESDASVVGDHGNTFFMRP